MTELATRVLRHSSDGQLLSEPDANSLSGFVQRTQTRGGVCPMVVVSALGSVFYSPAQPNVMMGCDLVRSRDAGRSFELVQTPRTPARTPDGYTAPRLRSLKPEEFVRLATELAAGATLHPGLWLDAKTGRLFSTLTHKGACADGSGSIVAFSDDDGETWTARAVGDGAWDWGKLLCGPAATERGRSELARSGYPHMLYFSATGPTLIFGPNQLTYRSSDGGQTWQRTGDMFDARQLSSLQFGYPQCGVVAADGAIYKPWAGSAADYVSSADTRIPVHVARSLDEGDSWQAFPVPNSGTRPLGASMTVATDGTLYLAWADCTDGQIRLTSSVDRAQSWSEPRRIRIPGVMRASKPTIHMRGSRDLALACWGSAQAIGTGDGWLKPDGRPYDGYLTRCRDITATEPEFVTLHVRDSEAALLPQGESLWHSGEYLGAPAFAPDGKVWAGFLSVAHGGLVAAL